MNKLTISVLVAGLVFGSLGGFLLAKGLAPKDAGSLAMDAPAKTVLYWKAPMDPNFRSDQPGTSPMGMDLVPVYAGSETGADDRNLVRINPTVQNNIGVRIAPVVRDDFSRDIDTIGFIQIDDENRANIDVRSEGWIEKLYVQSMGERIAKGRPLFDLYSKPLVTAQEEYLQARRIGRDSLIRAAKGRLTALGMSRSQIKRLDTSGKARRLVRVYAPQDGVITMLNIAEGAFVMPGKPIMSLAELSSVWVLAEIFETQIRQVKLGQTANMTISSEPERQWNGLVDYIYPVINAASRTVQVRLRFDNPDGILRPEGYAKLTIKTEPKKNVLSIDREALIQSGKSTRVILALGDGQFQPAEVSAGMESNGRVEILSGLQAGENVVVSAQFLLDSESSLQGTALRMMSAQSDEPSPPKEAEAKGVIVSLMVDHGMVTIAHEPINDFGWPDMEMDFVTNPAFLDDLKPGDPVQFKVLEMANDNDNFVVTAIHKTPANDGANP
ncbi:MAG: efflux transporter periplasmic adaptor subunit [Robiginitomaculum sp.]|nr:MAG: efflux transporter periplasmic adaptor subunit [Robiginitomaculum sp.]